jgi:hypothetical protein
MCDKYDCPQFVKIIKARMVYLILNEKYANPWEFFVLGCQMEWEYLAKEALRKFTTPIPKPEYFSKEASHLPQYLSDTTITRIGIKGYTGYVRSFIAEQDRCSGKSKCLEYQWNNIADKFSFHDPDLDGRVEKYY